jgi:hypothetical protein
LRLRDVLYITGLRNKPARFKAFFCTRDAPLPSK